jgi:hypothetical protein
MSAVEIVPADRGMIRAVLENLREDDRLELAACEIDLDRLPDVIMRHKVFAFCAYSYETGPIAVWGMLSRRSGVGAGFAFGTEHWGMVLLPMLRQIRQFVLPFLESSGYHRVEAAALARRRDVARFMSLIGAEPEGMLHGYGSGRESFISYRWLVDEYTIARAEHPAPAHRHATH